MSTGSVEGSAGPRVRAAAELMERFAERTGLDPAAPDPRRYLWTDAFAVCNYLGLYAVTGRERFARLARSLVDQVHTVLGRHRSDADRSGWLSGLSEEEGERRPTAGGLRIGKPLPDRAPGEPYVATREWDRDGQYYHYLTKWMHALDRMWRTVGEPRFHGWAVDLAQAAHRAFSVDDARPGEGEAKRLYWKVSVDGSRPLLPSSGHHDPLDGLLTISALLGSAPAGESDARNRLGPILDDLEGMCRGRSWSTHDPLGAGGLLVDVHRARRDVADRVRSLEADIVDDAARSLDASVRTGAWGSSAANRIAFRELGLSLGIHAAEGAVASAAQDAPSGMQRAATAYGRLARVLEAHAPLAERIERFWLDPSHQTASTWRDHHDISAVMLATSLAPQGFLGT